MAARCPLQGHRNKQVRDVAADRVNVDFLPLPVQSHLLVVTRLFLDYWCKQGVLSGLDLDGGSGPEALDFFQVHLGFLVSHVVGVPLLDCD